MKSRVHSFQGCSDCKLALKDFKRMKSKTVSMNQVQELVLDTLVQRQAGERSNTR